MRHCLLIAVTAAVALPAGAEDVYERVYGEISRSNADIMYERQMLRAEYLERKAENRLEAPEIEFGRLWGTNTPENKWDLSVTQQFDFPTLYSGRRRAAAGQLEAGSMAREALMIEKCSEARGLLIEVAYCDKVIAMQQSVVDDLRRIAAYLETAFANGQCTILDVNKSKIELANAIIALSKVRSERMERVAGLNVLTAGGVEIPAEGIPYPLQRLASVEYYLEQLESNPLVMQYDALRRASLLDYKVARMGGLPQVTLGYMHEREGADSFDGFTVGLSLPFITRKSDARAAQARLAANELMAEARRDEFAADIRSRHDNVSSMKATLDMVAPLFVADHPRLLKKAFDGGQMSAAEYLTELVYFRNAEIDYLEMERDYNLALSGLNKFADR